MHWFNAWDEPWVPIVDGGGTTDCSLSHVFAQAHEIRQLDRANPLVEVAVFRLLLAIVVDALGLTGDDRWRERWRSGQFDPAEFERYAALVKDRFYLFDDVAPFYQVADLCTPSGKVGSTLLLFPEMASGNNVPLYSSATEGTAPPVLPAEAARRLVALQAFDCAGLKSGAVNDPLMAAGKTTGNPIGPLGLIGAMIPQGRNLFDSLMLSLPPTPVVVGDTPAWRRPPAGAAWETRPSRGVLDLLTWQSRRLRLVPDDVTCPQTVVGVVVAAGDRLDALNPSHEPHAAWRAADASRGGMSQTPVRLQPGRAAWRGLDAMVALNQDHVSERMQAIGKRQPVSPAWALQWIGTRNETIGLEYPLGVRTVGVAYGNQRAVIDHTMSDAIPLPVLALTEEAEGIAVQAALIEIVAMAETIRIALNQLANNLLKSLGGTPIPWDKGEHLGDRFIQLVDTPARRLLEECRDDPGGIDGHLSDWQSAAWLAAWSIADPVLRQAPPAAFLGRQTDADKRLNQAQAERFFAATLTRTLPQAARHFASERRQ